MRDKRMAVCSPEHCRRKSLCSCGPPGYHQTAHAYMCKCSYSYTWSMCSSLSLPLPLQLLPTTLGLNSQEFKSAFMTDLTWNPRTRCLNPQIWKPPSPSLPPGDGCAVLCPDSGAARRYYGGLHQLCRVSVKRNNYKIKRFSLHAQLLWNSCSPIHCKALATVFPLVQQHLI